MSATVDGTPVTLSAFELLGILKEEAFRCTQLGVHLKIKYGTVKTMERQSLASIPINQCFIDMCQHWLTNATDKTWNAVYTALVSQENKRLMKHLRDTRKYSPTSTVDLPVQDFKKELDEMTAQWYLFGCALKIPVKVLKAIEQKGGMRCLMMAILEKWLMDGDATWEQLQQALIDVGNRKLAEDIETYKKEDMKKQQQQAPQMPVSSEKQDQQESKQSGASASSGGSKYMCQAFYQKRGVNKWKTTLTCYPHDKSDAVKSYFKENKLSEGISLEFDFELEQVQMKPQGQPGWAFTSPNPQTVSKASVDGYEGQGKPPHSEIMVTAASSQSTPPDLNMAVQLDGAKPPNVIQLERKAENPPSTTPPSSTAQHVKC